MIKVSVIVPVYNVYDYLDRCLDSLAKQTLKEIEILIINDGSPDNSQEIIDKYVKKYSNMKSYTKENGGLSDARNYGIERACGEYIAFLDSDDYVSYDMYEKMYDKAISNSFDIVVCNLNYVYEDKTIPAYSNIKEDTNDIKKIMLNIYPAAWNKIFKRELFASKIRFKKGVWFEDVEFLYRLLPDIKSIGVLPQHFNQYVQREGSITNSINKKVYDYINNWNGIIEYYKKNNIYNEYKRELEYCYVRYIYATFIKHASKYNYNDYLEAVDTAIKNVSKSFPKYRTNKYFYKNIKGIYLVMFNKTLAKIYYKLRRGKDR